MGQEEENTLTQGQARLLWRSDPEEAFRRFRNEAITLIEICAAVHFEAKIASDPTELSVIFEPFRELLTSARESAKNLWWCTPLPEFLTRSQPVVVVSRGDLRSRLDGSCYHEVAINCADALLGGVDAGNTARQHAAHLRFHTGRGDLVTDYLKSLVADIRCEFRDGLDSFRLSRASKGPGTNAPCGQAVASQAQSQLPQTVEVTHQPRPFAGGTLEFLADSVRLCGVEICVGGRPKRMREILELLRQKTPDGSFRAIGGAKLAEILGIQQARVASLLRDLRKSISASLSGKGIHCGRLDVILSGGSGYRLADCLSVQPMPHSSITDITDITDTEGVSNVQDGDVRDEQAARRRTWILEQLAKGVRLKAPQIAQHFKRSTKTAQRDLDTLRESGLIEFVGDPRTGYYRLSKPRITDPG